MMEISTEYWITVEGALERSLLVSDRASDTVADSMRELGEGIHLESGCDVALYVLAHFHAADDVEDCECAQYAQDHRPIAEWVGA